MIGTGVIGDPYLVGTAEDLKAAMQVDSVNQADGVVGLHIELTADIDLEGIEWSPQAEYIEAFDEYMNRGYSGLSFDGKGFTVSNFVPVETCGLFGKLTDSVVKNLNIDKVASYSTNTAGLAWEVVNSNLENCKVLGFAFMGSPFSGARIAAFAGEVQRGSVIKNCDGTLKSTGSAKEVQYVAGFAYDITDSEVFDSNAMGAFDFLNDTSNWFGSLSGFVCSMRNATIERCAVKDLLVTVSDGTPGAGGGEVFGFMESDGSSSTAEIIRDCYSTLKVKYSGKEYFSVYGLGDADPRRCPPDEYQRFFSLIDFDLAAGTDINYYAITSNSITEDFATANQLKGAYISTGDATPTLSSVVGNLAPEALSNPESFPGWDFSLLWSIKPGAKHPTLNFIPEEVPYESTKMTSIEI